MAQPPSAHVHGTRIAIVGAVALLLAACGSDPTPAAGPTGAPVATSAAPTVTTAPATPSPSGPATVPIPPVDGPHNEIDVMFTSDMVPHHRQAVEMAELARTRAADPRVKALAERIEKAQNTEITLMAGWLKGWGEKVPAPDEMHTSHGPGMMTHAEMVDLKASKGAAFDRMFVEMMIRHHRGALEMADITRQKGQNPAVRALATNVFTTQTAEVDELNELLAGL